LGGVVALRRVPPPTNCGGPAALRAHRGGVDPRMDRKTGRIRIAGGREFWSAATCRSFRFADASPPDAGALACVGSRPRDESKAVTCPRSPHARVAMHPEVGGQTTPIGGLSPDRTGAARTTPPPATFWDPFGIVRACAFLSAVPGTPGKDPFPEPARVPQFDPKPTASGCTVARMRWDPDL
jgi:hypothetical protein